MGRIPEVIMKSKSLAKNNINMESIIEFLLNYIISPILLVVFGIWKLFSKLIADVTKHIYGKILIPFIAVLVVSFLTHLLIK